MPYYDVKPDHPFFRDIQAIGATGILQGVGEPFQWANRTWFYPTQRVRVTEVASGLKGLGIAMPKTTDSLLRAEEAFAIAAALGGKDPGAAGRAAAWTSLGLGTYEPAAYIERAAFARMLNAWADPFGKFPVDHRGRIVRK